MRRLINDYAPNLHIQREEPVRGGQLKSMISQFNRLAQSTPVILLEDLDTEDCAPIARRKLLNGETQSEDFIINIAVDEAEAWLYADPLNLSKYLKVPVADIPVSVPQKMGGIHPRLEVDTPIKTSMHLTKVLINTSTDNELIKMVKSPDGRCKGREYNPAIEKFVEEKWNPELARNASYSLNRMIVRIQALNDKYSDRDNQL